MPVSREEVQRRMRAFAETCRRKRLKATHQRMEVFRELAGTDQHPDAEAVYERVRRRVPAMSLDTVYRTLATLEQHGLIRRTEVLAGPGRYDANTDAHHHFVCTRCGRVQDFSSAALDGLPIPRSAKALGQIESAHVQVRGVCAACARRRGGATRPRKA